ncbi:hypothetical protein RSAG8_09626, partial [Rhizoctonia solani AG-8 WAC10335]
MSWMCAGNESMMAIRVVIEAIGGTVGAQISAARIGYACGRQSRGCVKMMKVRRRRCGRGDVARCDIARYPQ